MMKWIVLFLLPISLNAASVDVPPFTYYGRITNDQRQGMDISANGNATIAAYKGDVLLAKSKIATVEGVSYNYLLHIPMGNAKTSSTSVAIYGDNLTFKVDDGNGIYALPSETIEPVGTPGRTVNLNFQAAEDANANGIADSYEELMKDFEGNPTPGEYDPEADSDGDGFTNRQEYELGTNPFDPEDAFRLLTFEPVADHPNFFKITFLTSRGRNYCVMSESKLSEIPAFKVTEFKKDVSENASAFKVYNEGEKSGIRTLYLLRTDDSSSFIRLRAE